MWEISLKAHWKGNSNSVAIGFLLMLVGIWWSSPYDSVSISICDELYAGKLWTICFNILIGVEMILISTEFWQPTQFNVLMYYEEINLKLLSVGCWQLLFRFLVYFSHGICSPFRFPLLFLLNVILVFLLSLLIVKLALAKIGIRFSFLQDVIIFCRLELSLILSSTVCQI